MSYIYTLEFRRGNEYYVGSTTDIDRRIVQHKNGNVPSTKRLGVFNLVFVQEVGNIKLACSAEKKIKSWKRRDFIEKIIKDGKFSALDS